MQRFRLSQRERVLAGCLLVAVLLLGYMIYHNQTSSSSEQSLTWAEEQTDESSLATQEKHAIPSAQKQDTVTTIYVDVKGAVASPGVYQMNQGTRVIDVIHEAGGFLDKAAKRQVNLAQRLVDEMVIYVPKQGKAKQKAAPWQHASSQAADISINRAGQSQLEELPGIGEVKANNIIQYRKRHGPFTELAELKKVTGIGDKTFAGLKDLIRL